MLMARPPHRTVRKAPGSDGCPRCITTFHQLPGSIQAAAHAGGRQHARPLMDRDAARLAALWLVCQATWQQLVTDGGAYSAARAHGEKTKGMSQGLYLSAAPQGLAADVAENSVSAVTGRPSFKRETGDGTAFD